MPTVIPLGTSSAMPAHGRHFSAVALWRAGRLLLFDCGEGTQLQLAKAQLKGPRLDAVFITHLHGDHFYGLMGLMATLGLLQNERPLTIVGPDGLEAALRRMPGLSHDWLSYEVRYRALAEGFAPGVVYEGDGYDVTAHPLEHSSFAVGYRYEEHDRPGHLDVDAANALGVTDYAHYRALKAGEAVTLADGRTVAPAEVVGPSRPGAVFAYVTDTRPCDGGRALARGADLLYHEATFTHDQRARAVETGHATAREAAEVARDAGARRLLLSHFSARYESAAPLVDEARAVFPATDAAEELARYDLAPRDTDLD